MNKLFYSTLTVVFLLGFSTLVKGQQVFKTTPTTVIPYLEYVPQDYNSNSNKYPVVFFLHGIGERGPNSTSIATLEAGVWTIAKNGPPKLVKYGQQFPFILISIQLKNSYGTWPTWYVKEVIDHVKTYLRIDERQMHITGLSMGGGGAFGMAYDYPQLFATASPICAGYVSMSKACNIAGENLPIWAFHGDADTTVPYTQSVNMINAINACSPTPSPKAKLTIYPGVNHNSWDRAYTPNNTYHTPNLYEWMLSYTNTASRGNKIPVTTACTDKSISGSTTTLNASATDADGTISSYSWKQISGATCSLSSTTSASPTVSNLTAGTYAFKVTATDNAGATDTDYVQVTVQGAQVTLSANAGSDVTIASPTTSATLTGSATGTISSYKWTFVSGPKTPVLTNSTSAAVSVSDLTIGGSYVLQLEVRDSGGAVATDRVAVTVNVSTTNIKPVANAGGDITLVSPTNSVTINGSGTDADGTITKYQWTQVSGPSASTLSGATTPTLSATNLKVGTYIYKLTVTDNMGAAMLDKVYVTIQSPL
jgi:predicted esterase